MVCVSSTQIPHIVRRVCSQATGLPMGDIRIIKPYIGGGFGNKQDVLTEPLNIFLSKRLGGRCVKLFYTREEVFVSTRVRHAMNFRLTSWVRKDGTFAARKVLVYSNQGAYASHAHALAANAVNAYRMMYPYSAIHGTPTRCTPICPPQGRCVPTESRRSDSPSSPISTISATKWASTGSSSD